MAGKAVPSQGSPAPTGRRCQLGVQPFKTPICLPALMLLPTQGTPGLPSLGRTGCSWPEL